MAGTPGLLVDSITMTDYDQMTFMLYAQAPVQLHTKRCKIMAVKAHRDGIREKTESTKSRGRNTVAVHTHIK